MAFAYYTRRLVPDALDGLGDFELTAYDKLVYAYEHEAIQKFPWLDLEMSTTAFVHHVEDLMEAARIDLPSVVVCRTERSLPNVYAFARISGHPAGNIIGFPELGGLRSSRIAMHELAHISAAAANHEQAWQGEYVRIARAFGELGFARELELQFYNVGRVKRCDE